MKMPAPNARSSLSISWTRAVQPRWRNAMAATRPAKPAPAISACMLALLGRGQVLAAEQAELLHLLLGVEVAPVDPGFVGDEVGIVAAFRNLQALAADMDMADPLLVLQQGNI